jgi:SAM-dependent methyltransferase
VAEAEQRRDPAAFFNEQVARYDSAYEQRGAAGHALRARLEVALRLAGQGPGEALDAGMGPGRLLAELAGRGWAVSGVDPADGMVAAGRRRVPQAASRITRAVIERLPFADGSFDLVLATGVLEYADVPQALAELVRVLRTGGHAIVSYPNAGAGYSIVNTLAFYPTVRAAKRLAGYPPRMGPRGSRRIAPRRFRELLSNAGLEPQRMEYTSFLAVPPPLDMLLPGVAERIGRGLEGSSARLGRVLATQVVFSAWKPERQSGATAGSRPHT